MGEYSAKAVLINDATVALERDRADSPPRLYRASEQIAFNSSKVKGTNGRTVVILERTEAYQSQLVSIDQW